MFHFYFSTFFLSISPPLPIIFFFFFFNDTAPTEIYTLSLHDALPICPGHRQDACPWTFLLVPCYADRKSTRLNSSHEWISYAVFCLKKKKRVVVGRFVLKNDDGRGSVLAVYV